MYVCMYVCTYACMHACMHACSLGSNPLRVGRRDRPESSRVLVHFGVSILSLPGLTPGPSCCPPSYVEVLSLPMDSVWYSRFIDERPGLCFLSVCCWTLHLLSGLSQVGCLWARRAALAHGIERGFRAGVLSAAPVRAFLDSICDFSSRELLMVFEVIRQHLFPDSPSRCLFWAAQMDPRSSPVEAFRAASPDLSESAYLLGPTLPGVGGWPETPSQITRSVQVEDVLAAVTALPCPPCPLLSSSLAGVCVCPFVDWQVCWDKFPIVSHPFCHPCALFLVWRRPLMVCQVIRLSASRTITRCHGPPLIALLRGSLPLVVLVWRLDALSNRQEVKEIHGRSLPVPVVLQVSMNPFFEILVACRLVLATQPSH